MKYEITEEQIKETYEATSVSNQDQLKKWFPKVFETKLEIGKWYTPLNMYEGKALVFCTDNKNFFNFGYGINYNGDWCNTYSVAGNQLSQRLATDSEVLEALTNEAKKRGLEYGAFCKWPNANLIEIKEYFYKENYLYCDKNSIIMDREGNWATPIKTYTKEEAEKMLNAKIV